MNIKMKIEEEEYKNDKGSSIVWKDSWFAHVVSVPLKGIMILINTAGIMRILFGAKLGTTEEIYVKRINTPPK